MSDLKTVSLFDTFVYQAEIPEYLEDKDFMAACDEHTDKAIADAKQTIEDRHKKLNAPIKDHGMSYHSGAELYKDERFGEFELLIRNTARNILEDQGFDLSNTCRIILASIITCFLRQITLKVKYGSTKKINRNAKKICP